MEVRAMLRERLGRLFYRLTYEHGKPRWDTGVAPEPLVELVGGLPAGRFLDLGCGTGTTAVRLAGMGWEVVGIDYVPAAVTRARGRAADAGVVADFRVGDVTRLEGVLDGRRFDLILDVGCYHGLSEAGRVGYAAAVSRAAAPGATFLLFGFRAVPPLWRLIGASGLGTADAATRFAPWFTIEELPVTGGQRGRSAWYRLRRREDGTTE
jgi:SAM-dependent methyltransferase